MAGRTDCVGSPRRGPLHGGTLVERRARGRRRLGDVLPRPVAWRTYVCARWWATEFWGAPPGPANDRKRRRWPAVLHLLDCECRLCRTRAAGDVRIRKHIPAGCRPAELFSYAGCVRYCRGEEAMRHLLWMTVFAALTAVVFGIAAKGDDRQKLMYGLKVFGEFLVVAFLLGWILYFIPFR